MYFSASFVEEFLPPSPQLQSDIPPILNLRMMVQSMLVWHAIRYFLLLRHSIFTLGRK